MHTQHVAQWMTKRVLTIEPDEPLFAALEMMAEAKIRHVLVKRGEELVGILSNRDIIRATTRYPDRRLHLHETLVEEVMTEGPIRTTTPEATLGATADRMLRHRINALPVYDGARQVGIITSDDVLRAVSHAEHQGRRPDV